MSLAVTHVIFTILAVDLFRDYIMTEHKRYLTMHTLLIAGIAGLLPDIDVPINWILNSMGRSLAVMGHGGITHTPIFGLIFLIPAIYLWKKEKHTLATYFFVITFGILFHISLDYILGGGAYEGIMVFWPISLHAFKIHLIRNLGIANIPVAIDAFVLLIWLYHEEVKHKITDFI